MIHFSRRNADFGNLGEDTGQPDIDSETEKKGSKKDDESSLGTDLAKSLIGGGGMGAGALCGACGDKDKQAEDKKKAELQSKYPLRDCGASPTAECISYNKKMTQLQEEEFKMWQEGKDASLGDNLPPSEKENFGFVADLAKQLKAKHPEAGSMTLSEIYKRYPDDFDRIYEQLKTKYPFLKAVDAQTALAMSPGIAKLTLDQLIARTSAISGMGSASGASKSGASSAMGVGILAALGLGALLLLKRRD